VTGTDALPELWLFAELIPEATAPFPVMQTRQRGGGRAPGTPRRAKDGESADIRPSVLGDRASRRFGAHATDIGARIKAD
jgi:hypothetical protein